MGSNRPFPSSLVTLFQNESKSENEFCMQFHFHANQSNFHKNGFTLRLALKQRRKGTRKWPNQLLLTKFGKNFVILNQWRQNDVKSTVRCRLLSRWLRKPGDEVVLFLVSIRNKKRKCFKTPLRMEKFWANNKAMIEFRFHRIWRIPQI